MIVTPNRRIMLSESDHGRLEILIIGVPDAVANEWAAIRAKLEAWPGFRNIATIVMGLQPIGLRCDVTPQALHLDPIAEWWRVTREDQAFIPHVQWRGLVGTW